MLELAHQYRIAMLRLDNAKVFASEDVKEAQSDADEKAHKLAARLVEALGLSDAPFQAALPWAKEP